MPDNSWEIMIVKVKLCLREVCNWLCWGIPWGVHVISYSMLLHVMLCLGILWQKSRFKLIFISGWHYDILLTYNHFWFQWFCYRMHNTEWSNRYLAIQSSQQQWIFSWKSFTLTSRHMSCIYSDSPKKKNLPESYKYQANAGMYFPKTKMAYW